MWIQIWQDSGTLTADDTFGLQLADRNRILDEADRSLWEEYQVALKALAAARCRVTNALREPTDEERVAYRAKITEHLKDLSRGSD